MAKTVFDVLIDKFQEHRASYVDALAGGRPADFAAYREQCGLIRGLDIALREVQDLSRHYLEDEDE